MTIHGRFAMIGTLELQCGSSTFILCQTPKIVNRQLNSAQLSSIRKHLLLLQFPKRLCNSSLDMRIATTASSETEAAERR